MRVPAMFRGAGVVASAVCILTSACAGPQSALDVRGPGARLIADIWWRMFALGALVYVVVASLVIYLLLRRRTTSRVPDSGVALPPVDNAQPPDLNTPPGHKRWILIGGVLLPLLILPPLFLSSVSTLSSLARDSAADFTVHVTGHQYWWDITYRGLPLAGELQTANEIHIPVGRRIRLEVATADVIHSLWIPNLQGKIDLVPGRTNIFWLQADSAGTSRAQCAEYCGLQHTRMSLLVVAETQQEFDNWVAAQQAPAVYPTDSLAAMGEAQFASAGCVSCHTIRGAAAAGTTGPDLTHVASRRTLAAGMLLNNTDNLRAWIASPQSIKRGNKMPDVPLTDAQLEALVRYMETLR